MNNFRHLVVRGDEFCYEKKNAIFPFVDRVANAGATGIHIWFWKEPYLKIKDEFIEYCHHKSVEVHLGIGIGAYGICDGEDPADSKTMRKIKDHVARVLDTQNIDGIELQSGEYDDVEYKGNSQKEKAHAQKLVDTLNPYLEYIHELKPALWLRTELLTHNFKDDDIQYVACNLDRCCTVEWSESIGPFDNQNIFAQGRELLAIDQRFSWFLKTLYRYHDSYVGLKNYDREKVLPYVEQYREWIKMLYEYGRNTLTICHVPREQENEQADLLNAIIRLARNPNTPDPFDPSRYINLESQLKEAGDKYE